MLLPIRTQRDRRRVLCFVRTQLTAYFYSTRTVPSKLGIENIAQKFRQHKIQGLIIIGGYEVTFDVLLFLDQVKNGCANTYICPL